jgi:HAD superfamily hydrolase (TIGR01549 family)
VPREPETHCGRQSGTAVRCCEFDCVSGDALQTHRRWCDGGKRFSKRLDCVCEDRREARIGPCRTPEPGSEPVRHSFWLKPFNMPSPTAILPSRGNLGDLQRPHAFVFDLDQTLVDSSSAAHARKHRDWDSVYSLIPTFRVYPGVDRLFATVGERPMSIVTSAPYAYADRVLGHFGLRVDALVCYHDTRLHKPAPEPLFLAIERLRSTPRWSAACSIVWAIGDHANDIVAAKAAGLVSVGAAWGCQDKSGLLESRPDVIFSSAAELAASIV